MSKCGTAQDHCCWLKHAGKCTYVRAVDNPPYRWECSLRTKYGSWEAVHASTEYQTTVKPALQAIPILQDCGSWPPPGEVCNTCGQVG